MFYNNQQLGMAQGNLRKADDEDGSWITMNGTHVHMKDGEVDKGPQGVKDHVAGKKASEPKSKREPIKIDATGKSGATEKQAAFIESLRDQKENEAVKALHESSERSRMYGSTPQEAPAQGTLRTVAMVHAMDAIPSPQNSREASKMIDALKGGDRGIATSYPSTHEAYKDAVTRFGYSGQGTAGKTVEGLHGALSYSGQKYMGPDREATLANLRRR
jgi:uncharacterized protein YaaR (DUF327 family)